MLPYLTAIDTKADDAPVLLNTTHNTRDMATLSLPEKTSKDLLLVYKYTKAEGIAKLQTAENLALEVGGDKYDGPVTIAKYLASKTQPELLGDGKDNQAEVEEWTTWGVSAFKSNNSKEITPALQKLNGHLSTRTFVVSNQLTIADLIIFGNVHGVSKHVKVTNVPNVLRWLDLIQNIVVVKNNLVAEFPLVPVNLDDVPEPVIAAAGKDKKKGDKDAKKGDKKEGAEKKEEGKKDKKDKKAKKEKKEKKELLPLLLNNLPSPVWIFVSVTFVPARNMKVLIPCMLKKLILVMVKVSIVLLFLVWSSGILLRKCRIDGLFASPILSLLACVVSNLKPWSSVLLLPMVARSNC